jgi:hypothetical protein
VSNIFDTLQNQAFDVVTNTMGYVATWQPTTGALQTAKVLYDNPDEKQTFNNADFEPQVPYIEYRKGFFEGLKEAVDNKEIVLLTVNGQLFHVLDVNTKFDGKTVVAKLQKQV